MDHNRFLKTLFFTGELPSLHQVRRVNTKFAVLVGIIGPRL